jgi:hypothetical protein
VNTAERGEALPIAEHFALEMRQPEETRSTRLQHGLVDLGAAVYRKALPPGRLTRI